MYSAEQQSSNIETPDRTGKTAVVTGASSGVGRAAAILLAEQGWHVIALGRNPERSRAAFADIREAAHGGAMVEMLVGDLASLADTARLADEILNITDRIDLLCNNAGGVRRERLVTPEGNEATFAGNHLGHFLLTKRLMPTILATAAMSEPAAVRVVSVSSEGHRSAPDFDWHDLQRIENWVSGRAYCLAKLCNLLFTFELARRYRDEQIIAHAIHPGEAATNFASHAVPEMQAHMATLDMIPPEVAGRTIAWLASSEEAGRTTGRYFFDCREIDPAPVANDPDLATRLWTASEALLARSGF